MPDKITVSVQDACHMTGLSISTIYRMFDKKELTRIRFGTKVLIRVDEIHDLINSSVAA